MFSESVLQPSYYHLLLDIKIKYTVYRDMLVNNFEYYLTVSVHFIDQNHYSILWLTNSTKLCFCFCQFFIFTRTVREMMSSVNINNRFIYYEEENGGLKCLLTSLVMPVYVYIVCSKHTPSWPNFIKFITWTYLELHFFFNLLVGCLFIKEIYNK